MSAYALTPRRGAVLVGAGSLAVAGALALAAGLESWAACLEKQAFICSKWEYGPGVGGLSPRYDTLVDASWLFFGVALAALAFAVWRPSKPAAFWLGAGGAGGVAMAAERLPGVDGLQWWAGLTALPEICVFWGLFAFAAPCLVFPTSDPDVHVRGWRPLAGAIGLLLLAMPMTREIALTLTLGYHEDPLLPGFASGALYLGAAVLLVRAAVVIRRAQTATEPGRAPAPSVV